MSEAPDYDTDVLTWSERQAALLRRRAAGELVNDTDLDWPNIAEEIESVGRHQLAQVKSLLVQALAHMLKAEAWPLSHEVPHWRAEALGFRGDAADIFTPSMRQRIDINELYARALRRVGDDGWPAVRERRAPAIAARVAKRQAAARKRKPDPASSMANNPGR